MSSINAGIRLGTSCWRMYCQEHEIGRDGFSHLENNLGGDDIPNSYFFETKNRRFLPRAIFIDLDGNPINEIKSGPYRKIFTNMISAGESASGIFARAKYSKNNNVFEKTQDTIRKLADDCTGLQGFQVHHTLGGGVGSGCTARILESLAVDYGKKYKYSMSIFPSLNSMVESVLEPYNIILSVHSLLEYADQVICFSNDSLKRMSQNITGKHKPSYDDLNVLARQFISTSTTAQRFDSALNLDITETMTGLVPYPRIHFMTCSYVPLIPSFEDHQTPPTVEEITFSVLQKEGCLSNIDPNLGKYMSCMLMYRGDVVPKEINSAVAKVKNTEGLVNFVEWSPTGFKCGINYRPPSAIPGDGLGKSNRGVGSMSNHTGIGSQLINPFFERANAMFKKRAFLHWYTTNGMEEGEFNEAFEDVRTLMLDYEEVATDVVDGEEEEEEEEGEREFF